MDTEQVTTTLTVPVNQISSPAPQEQEEPEEIEGLEKSKEYRVTPQFNDWVKYYTDKTEKDTYGNATKSAIKAYNLDPVRQYSVAGVIGHQNIKKHKSLAREFLESEGYSLQYMMAFALKKMQQSDTPGWWKEIMNHTDWLAEAKEEKINKTTNIQNNINVNVNSPEVVDFNAKLLKFIEGQPIE